MKENANAKPLNRAMIPWFLKHYLKDQSESGDPRIALVKADLKGLPPATVITAEIDPLRSEGQMATSAEWHEDCAQMSESARNFSRAAKSVQEGLEAVDWYNKHPRTYLFTEGDITQIEEEAPNH